MDEIMKCVAECSYTGIEVGLRHFDLEKPEYYSELLKRNKLEMIALHIGGDFTNSESVQRQMDNIYSAIRLAHKLECINIFISGGFKKDKKNEDFKNEAENYNKLGEIIRNEGLTLSYHNHNWEFANDACGYNIIVENTDPDNLYFVPDVGWITRAGYNPVTVIKNIKDRISNIHFKEFDKEDNIVELGTGIVDFKSVFDFIASLKDMWIIAEQDKTTIGAQNSVAKNYKFIKSLKSEVK